jgi:hypothetical protein
MVFFLDHQQYTTKHMLSHYSSVPFNAIGRGRFYSQEQLLACMRGVAFIPKNNYYVAFEGVAFIPKEQLLSCVWLALGPTSLLGGG